jgi:hypothetical protein
MTAESYRSYSADLFADTTNAVARTRWPPSSGTTFGILIFAIALVVGLATAGDYGITIDEFNTEDYGRKALAWYTSGFRDRASFEAVEPPLWYYGPWFQMLVAWVQSWAVADPLTIRHALTFAAGLCGLGALLPLGLLTYGAWAGTAALILCLTTGYLYGSLFFTPIDVPFMAAMSWATVAIAAMARCTVPAWLPTFGAGILTGLAIATRAGGIITHAYLVGAMALCALEACLQHGRAAPARLLAIGGRTLVAIAVAWLTAIALWPWLQIGNPIQHFWMSMVHFAKVPTSFEFQSWGQQLTTDDLPWTYIPGQLAARLPLVFLLLLVAAAAAAVWNVGLLALRAYRQFNHGGLSQLRQPLIVLAGQRGKLVVWAAATLPIAFLIWRHSTLYDGVRHVLFVMPMLALVAGSALIRLAPFLSGLRMVAVASAAAVYVGAAIAYFALLHPLEYVAVNTLAGGVRGAYGRFELDYWSAAGTEALRRLERLVDAKAPGLFERNPLSVVVCIRYREYLAGIMARRPWRIEEDPAKADFAIETERSRCAQPGYTLIDEVRRADRTFAWTWKSRSFHGW